MGLPEIPQTLSVELAKRLPLAWSPYVTLLTIDNPEERQSSAKDRDKEQFGDPFEALPTFLPEAERNWSDTVGPIGILGVRCHSPSKTEMARRLRTSRSQLDRLLDPGHDGVTVGVLARTAKAVGRELRLELA